MGHDEKVRENRLRRTAGRRDLTLQRSRRRDTRASDYGLYWVLDSTGTVLSPPEGLTLDGVEQFLE